MRSRHPGSIHEYPRMDPAQCTKDAPWADRLRFAQRQVDRFLQLTNITNFPVPVRPRAASFVVAKHDEYVPKETMEAQWKVHTCTPNQHD